MRRSAIAFLLLASLWQWLAIGGAGLVSGDPEGIAHAYMHWHNESHHHDDDGTSRGDPSGDSVRHVMLDGSGPVVALVLEPLVLVQPLRRAEAAAPPRAAAPPDPYLEGPRRPPRLHA